MLDEKDLQAIQKMIDASEGRMIEKIVESEERMTGRMDQKLAEQKQDLIQCMNVVIESEITPKFNLLADGIKDIQEKLVPRSRVDDLEDEVKFLKLMCRQMAEDIAKLKKAN